MARLTILVALLAAFVLVAHTCSASREGGKESCKKQIQRLNLKHCEKHIMERIGHEEEEEEDEDVLLTLRGGISYLRRGDRKQKKCCEELNELESSKCQCRALQKILDRQSEKLQMKEVPQFERELMNLPMRCGLGPMPHCELRWED
ncbi:2S seed storage albumin protein-like [Gastrolobium bilobum]|uniref:2S seed storage albumin protein-like n=1 Tax=Gastrolobium bilobum TaxID=150636 RepID=UPI002AB02CC7|nr:2S seed storage albumin protein-like [Gastrolobium bilobum]